MVDKTLVLKSRVNQLEKLCNDHISNMNEYEKEIEALIKTVSELGTISVLDISICSEFKFLMI